MFTVGFVTVSFLILLIQTQFYRLFRFFRFRFTSPAENMLPKHRQLQKLIKDALMVSVQLSRLKQWWNCKKNEVEER